MNNSIPLSIMETSKSGLIFLCLIILSFGVQSIDADCLIDQELNDLFEIEMDDQRQSIPQLGSCCMNDVCGMSCPETVPKPERVYGMGLIIAIIIFFIVGASTYILIQGSAENFFVAGRSLPLIIVSLTLAAQSLDSNALLGNVDNSYKYSFWDGAVLPVGLSLSLLINGFFLAENVHKERVLTLPDIFAKRYGKTVEILVAIATVISFVMLLAGNLLGMGVVLSYSWDLNEEVGMIWISAAVAWSYTVVGGLFSVAYTDVFQGMFGWSGCLVVAYYLFLNSDDDVIVNGAAPPSIGFPGYVYPDRIGDGGICDLYDGVPCQVNASNCCYNDELWCPYGINNCTKMDRGAYPYGDEQMKDHPMTNWDALAPYPNRMFWNWSVLMILAFGNVAALDFQARCMASKTSSTAKFACFIGAAITIFVGLPFSFLGSVTRAYYGPDSLYSQYTVDSCHVALGRPTCAIWEPDPTAFLKLLTQQVPPILGCWCMIGVLAAIMSTADGAILALGTVMSNNLLRQLDIWWPEIFTPGSLLLIARISTLPLTIGATMIAAYYRSNEDHGAGSTGFLLIVAFDIVFATVVVPLFGAFYTKKPSPRAALCSILGGGITRIVLEFSLKKDGSLIFPHADEDLYLNYGQASSTKVPQFMDVNETYKWQPTNNNEDYCDQEPYEDWSGFDSLISPIVSLIIFVSIQYVENARERPLFNFPGSTGYEKDCSSYYEKIDSWTKPVELLLFFLGLMFLLFTVFVSLWTNAL